MIRIWCLTGFWIHLWYWFQLLWENGHSYYKKPAISLNISTIVITKQRNLQLSIHGQWKWQKLQWENCCCWCKIIWNWFASVSGFILRPIPQTDTLIKPTIADILSKLDSHSFCNNLIILLDSASVFWLLVFYFVIVLCWWTCKLCQMHVYIILSDIKRKHNSEGLSNLQGSLEWQLL